MPSRFGHLQEHPVEVLARKASGNFEHLLQRQSRSYAVAEQEYRRRYGLEPPAGFEAWFEFAMANQSPIIDEFDTIYASIAPFLRLSGQDVVKIMRDAQHTRDTDLWTCAFSTTRAETVCTHPRRTTDRHIGPLFNRLLRGLGGTLPTSHSS